jgi:hypothetical protein
MSHAIHMGLAQTPASGRARACCFLSLQHQTM